MERTQVRVAPQFSGMTSIPPEQFQPRVRKEVNTRDTVNARLVESWNANTPIQQSISMNTVSASTPYFNRFADVYRVPTIDESRGILSNIPDYSVPTSAPTSNTPYEQTTTYAYILQFMKAIDVFDNKNNLYMVGALQDMFDNPTDRKDFLNGAIEHEKKAIFSLLTATYIDPTFGPKSTEEKIKIIKKATFEAFSIQRGKNIDQITRTVNAKLDAAQPVSLDAVFQDMAPQSSRQDARDFRQSQPYDSSGPNLSLNPYFDRYDPTRDPRNMVREVRSVVYEPKEPDRGLQESERIRARTFTNRNIDESETPIALTEWYNLMRPKIDNPEIVYRNQNTLWKLGSPLE